MPNKAAMYWYNKQKLEEEQIALSKLEKLLSEKTLTKQEDFNDKIPDEVYGLLTKIAEEKRIKYKHLAEFVKNYYGAELNGPCYADPGGIAIRATMRLKYETLQKMYFPDQPCA